jgi:riboflavin synthase
MFTGLVEAVGRVRSLSRQGEQAALSLSCPFAQEVAVGDSIAVNGSCLTVTAGDATGLTFDLLARTLEITSLGDLEEGRPVNLERAVTPSTRMGGHFVQGHVDATGRVTDLSPRGQDHRLEVALPPEVHRYCIDKGSIALAGISLTVAGLTPESAVFWIIPHTWSGTNLQECSPGQRVNLEVDLLAKYAERLLQARP